MGFDLQGFRKQKFEARTAEVRVADLADWFGEGDEPVFVVRGLTGEELARCQEAAQRNKDISQVVEALAASHGQEKVEAMREMLGVSESVPNDLAKRLEQFAIGTIDPDFNHEDAVKFAETYPVEFYQLTNRIMELTGSGRQPVKKKSSGETRQSEQPSASATNGGNPSTRSDQTSSPKAS